MVNEEVVVFLAGSIEMGAANRPSICSILLYLRSKEVII
jgi:hypothetical protein